MDGKVRSEELRVLRTVLYIGVILNLISLCTLTHIYNSIYIHPFCSVEAVQFYE